jgi:hypothetical protein
MNYIERENILLIIEDLERLILGDFQYSEEYTNIKKSRRIFIKGVK